MLLFLIFLGVFISHISNLWYMLHTCFSSVQSLSHVWLCDPMDCSTPGLPVHHQLLEPTQTHVHWVGDAIQPSHPLSSPSPPTLNLSQHQSFFKRISSSHQVAKVLEFQLQHQAFQWTPKTNPTLLKIFWFMLLILIKFPFLVVALFSEHVIHLKSL